MPNSTPLPPWLSRLQRRPVGAAALATALRRAIAEGLAPRGLRLPTSRDLALQLQIGRSTVVVAYETLAHEGLIESFGRRGTFIAPDRREPAQRIPGMPISVPLALRRRGPDLPSAWTPHLDWRLGQASALRLPEPDWAAACRHAGRQPPPGDYGNPFGEPALRDAIAGWLQRQRSLRVAPRQIVVTQGASHALELIIDTFIRPGDRCVVERPGYARGVELLLRAGARVKHVPVDEQGLVVRDAFSTDSQERDAPVLVHVTPGHQYPLGVRLSESRRTQLLALAHRHRTLIIENEYDQEFVQGGLHHVPLYAAAPQQTLLVGTFAKAISPSLRLGYVVAEPGQAQRLAATVARGKRQVSWPVQHAVSWLIHSGRLDKHLRRVQLHSTTLLAELTRQARGWAPALSLLGAEGGQHVFLRTPTRAQEDALARRLTSAGVALDRLAAFGEHSPQFSGVLMAYAHFNLPQLRQALALLGSLAFPAPRTEGQRRPDAGPT